MRTHPTSNSADAKPVKKHLYWYSKLLVSFVAIALFLLFLEGISILLMGWIKFPPVFLTEYRLEGNIVRDFDIGYVNKPNSTTELNTKLGKCRFHINANGLRNDYDVKQNKAGNEFRILCVGDSTVFGLDVDQLNTYPAQLEDFLNKRNNGTQYTVLNAGCPSYTSFQVMRFTETRLSGLNPDMIIISVGVNDAKLRDSEKSRDYRNGPLPLLRRLIFNTNTYLIISYIESKFAPIKEVKARKTPAVTPDEYADNLVDVIGMADRMGAAVMFCPISVTSQYCAVLWDISKTRGIKIVDAEESLLRAYREVEAGSDKYAGIPTDLKRHNVPLMGALADDVLNSDFCRVHGENLVMIDSVHPNPIGYRAIAEDLAAVIP